MKERPILFRGPMVRAILEGRKTQTRRIIKPQPADGYHSRGFANNSLLAPNTYSFVNGYAHHHINCPYGIPDDRLWVRETHLPKKSGTIYRADFSDAEAAGIGGMYGGWKPSIFCKREYSRILLEIPDIRAERLQEISCSDVIAEGIKETEERNGLDLQDDYATLWESINGPGSWDKNPWVWVVEFRRVDVR